MSRATESQFTHRQDSPSSYSSICLKCLRNIATREFELALRADEENHSCTNFLPGAKPSPAYWGIQCRTCADLVAFDTRPPQNSGLGAQGSRAGTIRCAQDHTHIYFPRDFRFLLSTVTIPDSVMRENLKTYKAVNPCWESASDHLPAPPSATARMKESDLPAEGPGKAKARPASLLPDPRRETATKAAKEFWAIWALKKTQ
jgi:hypothetical protein